MSTLGALLPSRRMSLSFLFTTGPHLFPLEAKNAADTGPAVHGNRWGFAGFLGGGDGIRTHGLFDATEAL